jgi:AhpD family alkylhydroperoxidase
LTPDDRRAASKPALKRVPPRLSGRQDPNWPTFLNELALYFESLARYRHLMADTKTSSEIAVRLDFKVRASDFYKAVVQLDRAATKQLDQVGFEPRLRELVRIRASQINGCAYCIDMHTKDARAVGETEQRLYALTAWRETPYFDARERSALAFTEVVTGLSETHVPTEAYDAAAAEFSEAEMAALIGLLVTINAWNAISVSTRAWLPGSYQP